MSPLAARIAGIVLIVAALLCVSIGIGVRGSVTSQIGRHYDKAPGSGRAYTCEGTAVSVADDIARRNSPEARSTEATTGTVYLRYNKNIVSVADKPSCIIRVEDLGRVSSGGLIFLGPGFTPSSPSGSSGGSSGSGGSGGGVK